MKQMMKKRHMHSKKEGEERQWKGWGGAAENRGGQEGMQGMGGGALCYFDLGLAGDNACG